MTYFFSIGAATAIVRVVLIGVGVAAAALQAMVVVGGGGGVVVVVMVVKIIVVVIWVIDFIVVDGRGGR